MPKVSQVEEVYKLLEMVSDNKEEFDKMSADFKNLVKDQPSLAELNTSAANSVVSVKTPVAAPKKDKSE